jgi:predicted pyridoxine 5'-phosphate oxidase superfamily flavin-nucleotide-binding protein
MTYGFMDIAITPSVRRAQAEMGADRLWSDFKGHREFDRFSMRETAFIAQRDSFYMASVSETGWPYVQHRGGPLGFLKVLDDRTLAFVDYRGNRQYISTGNLADNDRTCLFLMDYPARTRLKIYARAEKLALDADPVLTAKITDDSIRFLTRIAGFLNPMLAFVAFAEAGGVCASLTIRINVILFRRGSQITSNFRHRYRLNRNR